MKVMVTGATGLVGSHLAERLLERGDVVHALVRDRAKAEPLAKLGVRLAIGDLRDQQSLSSAMQDFDVLYHCAAQVALPHQGDRQHLININVEGTKSILRAAIEAGVKRLVFVSSVAVYGGLTKIGIVESDPFSPNGHYSESKIMAERAIDDVARGSSIEVVIIRPCVIYGPGDYNFLPQIMDRFLNGIFPLVSGGRQLLDLVYVSDVAEALVLAGTKQEAAGQAFNVTDGQQHAIREIIAALGKVIGKPFRTISVPYAAAMVFSALSYAANKIIHPAKEPLISPAGIRSMSKPHHYNIDKIRRELGFEPQVELEHGLEQTVRWHFELRGKKRCSQTHSWQGGF